jgi:hypothetical protein
MANYVINNKTNSFIIIKGNNSNPYSRNDLRISFSSDNDQILKIYDKTVNKYLLYDIDLNIDTVDVDGLTVFADAQSLYDALEPIFFLINGSSGSALDNRIIVNQSNATSTLGGVIDSSKEYFLDGSIDMGTTQITVPATGLNLSGYNFEVSGLFSTEDNYTMFISESIAIGSGNFIGKDYDISVSGANSKVYELYDATGFNAFEFARINYSNCTSLGDIYDYRQGLENGTGRFGGSPSLTLHGLWRGGYRISTSIVRSLAGTMTEPLFKEGTLFQMNSRFLTDMNADLPTLAALLDFQPLNFPNSSTLQLQEMIITRDGALNPEDTNITPNISEADLSSYWKSNVGLNNTYVGATSSVISEELTVIGAGSTWYDLEGICLTAGAEHFTGNAGGELTRDGVSPRVCECTTSLSIEGASSNELSIRFMKYDDATSSFTPLDYTITTRQINALVGGRDVAFFDVVYGGTLDQNDFLKLQVRNNSGNSNVTLENGSFFRVQER